MTYLGRGTKTAEMENISYRVLKPKWVLYDCKGL